MAESAFVVISKGRTFRFTPEKVGYSVSEVGVKGANTQGDTFEEALANAHEASRLMAEFQAEMRSGAGSKRKREKFGTNQEDAALASLARKRLKAERHLAIPIEKAVASLTAKKKK